METIRKSETPTETTDDAPIVEEIPPVEEIVVKPTLQDVLSIAPELYGINPSAQEIEDFREKEIQWRQKLKQL